MQYKIYNMGNEKKENVAVAVDVSEKEKPEIIPAVDLKPTKEKVKNTNGSLIEQLKNLRDKALEDESETKGQSIKEYNEALKSAIVAVQQFRPLSPIKKSMRSIELFRMSERKEFLNSDRI